jgi:hypothetical protein
VRGRTKAVGSPIVRRRTGRRATGRSSAAGVARISRDRFGPGSFELDSAEFRRRSRSGLACPRSEGRGRVTVILTARLALYEMRRVAFRRDSDGLIPVHTAEVVLNQVDRDIAAWVHADSGLKQGQDGPISGDSCVSSGFTPRLAPAKAAPRRSP